MRLLLQALYNEHAITVAGVSVSVPGRLLADDTPVSELLRREPTAGLGDVRECMVFVEVVDHSGERWPFPPSEL